MSTTPPWCSARRSLSAVVVVVLSVLLAGCDGGSPRSDGDAGRTIEHKYGSTKLPKDPKRIVTVGLNDQDAVLALGTEPVGVVDWFGERSPTSWPWSKKLWGEARPTVVGERDDFETEAIARLKPDLIIGQHTGMTRDQYRKLSEIAPTVAQSGEHADHAMPWREATKRIGRAVGNEEKANRLIAAVDRRFEQERKKHPEYDGQTMAVGESFAPGEYTLFAAHDPKLEFMTALGFGAPERITQLAGRNNAAEVGAERLDLLSDVDRMVWLYSDPSGEQRIKSDVAYKRSTVAREGRDLFVGYENASIAAAMTFNTVLSIPYAIDRMAPKIAENVRNVS